MTMAPHRPDSTLGTSDARETLLEMAAVIRAVFGAGLQDPRRAPAPVPPQTAEPPAVVAPDEPPVLPVSIALPPELPAAAVPPPAPEPPTPNAGEVPPLRVVPNPPEDVLPEHRNAVLLEIAFLDD